MFCLFFFFLSSFVLVHAGIVGMREVSIHVMRCTDSVIFDDTLQSSAVISLGDPYTFSL